MSHRTLAMVLLFTSIIAVQASAATQQQVSAFLGNYISGSAAASATILENVSIGSHNYTVVQINSTFQVVINVTKSNPKNWKFADSNATIYQVLKPYLVAKYYPSNSTIENLSTWLHADVSSTEKQYSGSLADCLQLTGAWLYACSPGAANVTNCMSNTCNRITNCGGVGNKNSLLAQAGIPSEATAGIQNMSIDYAILNRSYAEFFSAVNVNTINQGNIGTQLTLAQAAMANITQYSGLLSVNPLLSPPSGYNFGSCPPTGGTFPCDALGYCPMNTSMGFNWTVLSQITANLTVLQSLPITFKGINNVAIQDNNSQYNLEKPVEYKQALQYFQQTLAATFNSYTALSINMSSVLSHYSNSMLADALANMTGTYDIIIQNNVNQNFTTANQTLSMSVANALAVYNKAATPYLKLYGLALNNTNLILINELDYRPSTVPGSVLALAASETALNQELLGQLNDTQLNQLLQVATQINGQARGLSQPQSLTGFTKWVYGGMINALLSSSSQPISSKLAAAPVYVAVVDLIIALIIIAIIYELTYANLKRKGKLKLNPAVRRVWTIIFVVLLLIGITDAYIAYSYAQNANSFLPMSGFVGLLGSQSTAYVGLTSANQSLAQCASAISAALPKKTVHIVTITNFTCSYPNSTISGTACYNKIAANYPLVLLSQNPNSTIGYKGMYGYVLQVNGTFASGPSCPISTMVKLVS